jgi:hypothetical protein
MTRERVRELTRMTKAQLRDEYDRVLGLSNQTLIYGGPRTKDEFINAIAREEGW